MPATALSAFASPSDLARRAEDEELARPAQPPSPSEPDPYHEASPQARLFIAARLNDPQRLAQALSDGAKPDERHPRGLNALMIAAENGSLECLLALLALTDPNHASALGTNALMFAAHAGSLPCVLALLPLTRPEALSRAGAGALAHAAMANQVEIINALLEAGEPCPGPGASPLAAAASHGAVEACERLLALASQAEIDEAFLACVNANSGRCAERLAPLCSQAAAESAFAVCHRDNRPLLGETLINAHPWLLGAPTERALNPPPRFERKGSSRVLIPRAPLTDFELMIQRRSLDDSNPDSNPDSDRAATEPPD